MLDDDIQYLGTRFNTSRHDPQRKLTGIALHIEKSDGNDAHVLTFSRGKASAIHIGRRPTSEMDSWTLDQEKGRAMFRCAVVSRKHAKIVFSDCGHAYLIDLKSHHGTHIRRPGEISSRMLEPERSTSLSDGDIVTFGKTVGRYEEMVRPVVARVQLLYAPPALKPLVVPSASSTATRSNSGRYGIHSPTTSSDEVNNDLSDSYSDIEEVSPPTQAQAQVESFVHNSHSPSHPLNRALEVLKRLLPPSSISAPPPQQDVTLNHEPSSPDSNNSASSSSSSTSSSSRLPPLWSLSGVQRSGSPLPGPSVSAHYNYPGDFFSLPPINSFHVDADADGNRSRSESPMDLASPSPPPLEQSRPKLVVFNSFEPQSDARSDSDIPSGNLEAPAALSQSPEQDVTGPVTPSSPVVPVPTNAQNIDLSMFVTKAEHEELKERHSKLQEELQYLQAQRKKYKMKFNSNVHSVTDKFAELDDRLNDVNSQYTIFADQIENIMNMTVPDLQGQIDDLQDQQAMDRLNVGDLANKLDRLMSKDEKEEGEVLEYRDPSIADKMTRKEEAQAYLKAMQELVSEMKQLRAQTELEMKTELDSLRQFRQSIAETSTSSLKRKRSLEDEDEDEDEGENDNADPFFEDDVAMKCAFETGPHNTIGPSPRKRARQAVSVAAQTATAVTVGAIAAWTALAFY